MSASSIPPPVPSTDALTPFRGHPAFQLVELVARYLGIRPDLITCVLFFSLVSGRKRIPIHVNVLSDQRELDLAIVDRLGQILPESMATVDTYQQYRSLETSGFRGKSILHVRREDGRLFEDLLTYRATTVDPKHGSPSVWKISSSKKSIAPGSATLNVYSTISERSIDRFIEDLRFVKDPSLQQELRDHLGMLSQCQVGLGVDLTNLPVKLYDAGLSPDQVLIVQRLLQIVTQLRRILSGFHDTRPVCLDDYQAVRALLQQLPLVPVDRTISAAAIDVAERIYTNVTQGTYQLALPDRSNEGHKWFTREHVRKWTELGYNTVKKRLQELEDDGQIIASVRSDHRKQGTQLYYQFRDIHTPPNAWRNPFELLPLTP